jgi:7-keto-8-aminopelargonate synthetase-like enzyme
MHNNLPDNQYKQYTYDMFMFNMARELDEIDQFGNWIDKLESNNEYTFEAARKGAQKTRVNVQGAAGTDVSLLNFSSYNYLGFGYHPDVIQAAKDALDLYGLGAASSPVISGTYAIHKELEQSLLDYFDLPGRGISLFSSGYGVNVGTIQAFMKRGGRIILDKNAHMSLLEGAQLCGAEISYFNHNDMDDLEHLLKAYCDDWTRVLVCAEGVYSADGDYGNLREIVRLAKKYGAFTLVDEAHSVLVAGNNGRGVAEEHGVLDEVDLYIMTFSKAFGGVGGALLAKKEIVRYVNWYAKCRMFSCALDPAVTGGLVKVLELAKGKEGELRRKRIKSNAAYLFKKLSQKVACKDTASWVIPVMYYSENQTINLSKYIQEHGLDTSIVQFPAVPKNEARMRMFVTSEHAREELDEAAQIIFGAAKQFGFLKKRISSIGAMAKSEIIAKDVRGRQ